MHLLDAVRLIFRILFIDSAIGMVLGVIFGRAYIDPGIATGTLAGLGVAAPRRSLVLSGLIRLRLLLGERPAS
jgi:hypothetical protein